ncbi:putative glutathione S-transferase-related transmembrane protein [Serinicoccus hydrothermalis]|uniref:Putative glutathione S-transferase-related transmembrane protein n=1 Tax=Serinicoccus hydrothermalis TaxID=1758689 RepID=A0A1B1NCP8_9MICO|nr:SRPBCC domain-containing protein [Serinicoccus hydrothermalis]ANS79219.1 putative glutathione S-transferase-related transmembrane protein [Serinicoccus hydrothermalis]
MAVIDVTTDTDARTITIIAEFAAPVERVWELYADPRQLEQVFGPPGYPATFVEHELRPGSTSRYYMTGPEGNRFGGLWEIREVEGPRGFSFDDRFADAQTWEAADGLPVSRSTYGFEATEAGTRATYVSVYDSAEGLQQVLDMGVEEGATESINQIDGFLAA